MRSEPSPQGLLELNLGESERLALVASGITHWQQLRDLTLPALQARLDWPADVAQKVLTALDFWCQRRFRGELILPSLAAPCHDISLDYLPFSDSTLAVLSTHGIEYTYQLALSRRPRLEVWLGSAATEAAALVLQTWFADWRSGELEFYEEN